MEKKRTPRQLSPRAPRWGGGGTQQSFIRGGSAPRSNPLPFYTVESRSFEPLSFRTSRLFEPWHVSLGFASVKHCNFTPDFSNPRFFETPDISNQFLPPMEEIYKNFIFDFSNPHETFKVLRRSFHLNGHTSQTQKVQPPSITH